MLDESACCACGAQAAVQRYYQVAGQQVHLQSLSHMYRVHAQYPLYGKSVNIHVDLTPAT